MQGYTEFSGNPSEQEGNYLALKFEAEEGATTTVELINGTVGHPVTLDEDMNIVIRITNKDTQSIQVVTTADEVSKTVDLSLSGLSLEGNLE